MNARPIKVPNLPAPPPRFCNWERALQVMAERGIDGMVLRTNASVYYLSGFAPSGLNASLFETDDSYGAVVISRHAPEHPIVLVPTLNVGYFAARPTWIKDVRAFSTAGWGASTPLHVAETPMTPEVEFARYVPRAARETDWGRNAQSKHEPNVITACKRAIADLGLTNATLAFDDLRFSAAVAPEGAKVVDGLPIIRFMREVKTPEEVTLLQQAARINQKGIESAVEQWYPGMTWSEFRHAYHLAVVNLGGFVRDHGAAVINNDPSGESIYIGSSEDFELSAGTNIMFDFHGTANHYCWDGGKLWVIGDGLNKTASRIHEVCHEALEWLEREMIPGVNLLSLQTQALRMIRGSGLPGCKEAWITFHGMGLSHGEYTNRPDTNSVDRILGQGMCEAVHIWYPGDRSHRVYLEDVVEITPKGARSLYEWSFDPLLTAA